MVQIFQSPSYPILFQRPKGSGAQLNKRPVEFTMLSPNGITISKVADIIVRNDHKPLTKFLNGKNANNKVNRWGLELATYNIYYFEWISAAKNKAADCLSCLVELPQTIPAPVNMLSVSNTDGPTFNTRSQNLPTPYTRYFHSTT